MLIALLKRMSLVALWSVMVCVLWITSAKEKDTSNRVNRDQEKTNMATALWGVRKASIFVTQSITELFEIKTPWMPFSRRTVRRGSYLKPASVSLTRPQSFYTVHTCRDSTKTLILSLQIFCERFEQMQHVWKLASASVYQYLRFEELPILSMKNNISLPITVLYKDPEYWIHLRNVFI